jgi:hypothetical protein
MASHTILRALLFLAALFTLYSGGIQGVRAAESRAGEETYPVESPQSVTGLVASTLLGRSLACRHNVTDLVAALQRYLDNKVPPPARAATEALIERQARLIAHRGTVDGPACAEIRAAVSGFVATLETGTGETGTGSE